MRNLVGFRLVNFILEARSGWSLPARFQNAYFCGSRSWLNNAACNIVFLQERIHARKGYVCIKQSCHGNLVGNISVFSNLVGKVPYECIFPPHATVFPLAGAYRYQRTTETEKPYIDRLILGIGAELQCLGRGGGRFIFIFFTIVFIA